MSRPIGAAGLALIKQFEGCRLTAYKPVPKEKYWTIGWGHYGPDVYQGQTITQEQADALLVQDCQSAANAVDNPSYCPLTATLNANQRDALISFTFNCGTGSLRTLCRGRGQAAICEAMALYNKGNGGQVLPGLVRRRKAEQELFNTPVTAESEDEMTKEAFAKYMADYLADLEAKEPASWSAAERTWAETFGLIKGDDKGRKKYKAFPTREELVIILYRFARWLGKA